MSELTGLYQQALGAYNRRDNEARMPAGRDEALNTAGIKPGAGSA